MLPYRSAASSFNRLALNAEIPALAALWRRAGPGFDTDLGVAAAHEVHQLLRRRDIAVVAEAALLRHGPAIGLPCLHLLRIARLGPAASLHLLNNRLAGFTGRGGAA